MNTGDLGEATAPPETRAHSKRSRASHKMSRTGCAECKHRRIKVNKSRSLEHTSTDLKPGKSATRPVQSATTAIKNTYKLGFKCTYYGPDLSPPAHPVGVDSHAELLNKFSLGLISPGIDAKSCEHDTTFTLTAAARAPYLMHEILAVAAYPLAHICPERRQYYSDQATQLQNKALSFCGICNKPNWEMNG